MAIIYDISIPITPDMPVWPGDPAVTVSRSGSGGPLVSELSMGSHTGTHIDAPAHYIPGGDTVDQLPLQVLVGPAWVADIAKGRVIRRRDLENANIPPETTRLLLRTGNSDRPGPARSFDPDFAALAPDAAAWLLARNVRLVGIDAPSIEPYSEESGDVHRLLLGAGVVIVEGLALENISPGPYDLICLPLRVEGGDGAPARAMLLR